MSHDRRLSSAQSPGGIRIAIAATLLIVTIGRADLATAQDVSVREKAASPDSGNLLGLIPATAHEVLLIPDVEYVLAASRETPFGPMMADARFGETLKPLKSELNSLGRGMASAMAGGAGGAAESDLTWLKAALVAEVATRKDGKERNGRITILRHTDAAKAERMLLGRTRPRGALVARRKESVAGFPVVRLEIHTESLESIKATGEAKRIHKDSGISKSTRRGGVTKATRRSKTIERFYVGPEIAILATGGYQPMNEILTSWAKTRSEAGEDRNNVPSWMAPLLTEIEGDFLVFRRFDIGSSLRGGFGDLFGDEAEARALGMDDLKAAGFGLGLTREALQLDLAIHAPSPHRGIGRLLFAGVPINQSENIESIRSLIPAEATNVTIMRVDGAEWFREFLGLLKTGAPKLEALVRTYLEPPGMEQPRREGESGESRATNLGDVLGEWWVGFDLPAAPESDGSGAAVFMIALRPELQPKTVIGNWMTAIATLLNAEIDRKATPLGTRYSIGGGGGLMDGGSPLGPMGSFYVTDEWLVFAPEDNAEALATILGKGRAVGQVETPDALLRTTNLTHGLPSNRFYEAVSTTGPIDTEESGPVLMALYRVTESFFNSLVDLGSAPAEDAWSAYFKSMSLGMEAEGDFFRGRGILAYARDDAPRDPEMN